MKPPWNGLALDPGPLNETRVADLPINFRDAPLGRVVDLLLGREPTNAESETALWL